MRVASLFCVLSLSLALGACATRGGDGATRGGDGAPVFLSGQAAPIAFETWLDRLAEERVAVVFLGELHDNERHHQLQAAAVAGLERRFAEEGGVAGLVFEMIPQAQEQTVLETRGWPAVAGAAQSEAVGPAIDWASSGWPDWAMYAPILKAAPSAYLAGGGYPRRALMQAAVSADWLSREPEAGRFGLDRPLPKAQQQAREAKQIKSHCDAIPASVAPMMVDAQRARDGRLAAAALRARAAAAAEGRDGPVVVIAGSGHARLDYGAPALLRLAEPDLAIHALAFVEDVDLAAEGGADFQRAAEDAALFHAAAPTGGPLTPRGDPCAAFKRAKG